MNKIIERKSNAFPNVPLSKSTLTFNTDQFKSMNEYEKTQYLKQQAIDKQVANVTVEGSAQGGTGVSYESAWNNMTNEEKAKYGDYNKFVKATQEYHKTQNTKNYELTKNVTVGDRRWTHPTNKKDFGMTIRERNRIIKKFMDNNDQEGYERWLFETTGGTTKQWEALMEKKAAQGPVTGGVNYGFSAKG